MENAGNKGVIYEFGRFLLDPNERTFFADGIPVHLPAKEFDTLLLLVEHNGHALTKEEMMTAIWQDSFVEESNLAKQISRLRKILNTNGEQFIETLPKHGYRFSADLRRTLVEPAEDIIFEKRTVKRLTFALDKDDEEERPLLPPRRPRLFTALRIALVVIGVLVIGFLAWQFRREIFGTPVKAIDPYEPVRLTDNPNDDTGPQWTKDGKIIFSRIYGDHHFERWIMNADGSDQTLIKNPEGKIVLELSPDGQKFIYLKTNDPTKYYLSNVDGSGETPLPFKGGGWSHDSKTIMFMRRIEGDNIDIFTYSVESGQIQNVTNNPALDADGSFSLDDKQILFDSTRSGNFEIFIMNVDGSNVRQLTFTKAGNKHAVFSPDGTQILFTTDRDNETADVYIMNADGSNPTSLVGWDKTNETAGPGSWSPDGTRIAFFSDRNGGHDDIYVMSAETVRPKLILSDPESDLRFPAYSPDGKRVVYSRELEDKSGEIRILDIETGSSRLIKKIELSLAAPKWSPDGNRIAFQDRVDGNSDIFSISSSGTDLLRLTNDPEADAQPGWSPDGSRIIFNSNRGEGPRKGQLFTMNADGSDLRPVTQRKGWEADAVWSPDGRSIVFVCDREDSPGNVMDICEINVDGSAEKRVLFHRDQDSSPAVSPDGKRIAFVAASDGNRELYLMNRDGSGLLRLTRDPADDDFPEWSPDGKKIIFCSDRSGKFALYEIEVPG